MEMFINLKSDITINSYIRITYIPQLVASQTQVFPSTITGGSTRTTTLFLTSSDSFLQTKIFTDGFRWPSLTALAKRTVKKVVVI